METIVIVKKILLVFILDLTLIKIMVDEKLGSSVTCHF